MTKEDKENIYRKRKAGDDIEDDVDFGKMTFETKKGNLPFEATRNAPGTKKKKLRAAIREVINRHKFKFSIWYAMPMKFALNVCKTI